MTYLPMEVGCSVLSGASERRPAEDAGAGMDRVGCEATRLRVLAN
jgi:hypothetical protein